jgi:hypothetical protein
MLASLSVPELLSDLSADATAIAFDLPDGGYDRLHRFIEARGILPAGRRGRLTLIALVLLASRFVKQQLGTLGPVANFVNELGEDGIREEAKRILETVRSTSPAAPDATGSDALWDMTDAQRTALLSLYATLDEPGKTRLRSQLTRMTMLRLASLARLEPEQLTLVLDLLSPLQAPKAPATSVAGDAIRSVNEFFFPWMRMRREVSS